MGQMLHRIGVDGEHMHVHREAVAQLAARVGQTAAVIQREVHRLGVQHLAALAIFRHVAARQHPRHVLLRDRLPLQLDRGVEPIAARLPARETGDDVIDADASHFLCGLKRGADRALGLAHGANFTKTDPA